MVQAALASQASEEDTRIVAAPLAEGLGVVTVLVAGVNRSQTAWEEDHLLVAVCWKSYPAFGPESGNVFGLDHDYRSFLEMHPARSTTF